MADNLSTGAPLFVPENLPEKVRKIAYDHIKKNLEKGGGR
jgi:hypothetical protein